MQDIRESDILQKTNAASSHEGFFEELDQTMTHYRNTAFSLPSMR
jgi:hypothetical protein